MLIQQAPHAALGALAAHVTEPVRTLADKFWPGALTIVLEANPSLSWDLGETGGTVALRIPEPAADARVAARDGAARGIERKPHR